MNFKGTGRTTTMWRCNRAVASLALAAAALVAGAGSAAAHGGDSAKVHGCIATSNGQLSIVGPNGACKQQETALDWSATDTNTTYEAGAGLSLGRSAEARPAAGPALPDDFAPMRPIVSSNALAGLAGRVVVGDRVGDVLLEVAGSALVEVDFEDVVVERRDGGDEAAAVGVGELRGLAVA